MVSASMLTSGLHANQRGSALDFARAVAALTVEIPDIWTVHYTGSGKKSARNRLCHFLKRGSQGAPAEFWGHVSSVLSNIPANVLMNAANEPESIDDDGHRIYSSVLISLHEALNSRDEVRTNQGAAWNTYLHASELVLLSLPDVSDQGQFYRTSIFPVVIQYIRPLAEQARWTVVGTQQKDLCARACTISLSGNLDAFREEWQALSTKIIEDLKISLPEQSKEFAKSQDAVAAETDRWYRLQASILEVGPTEVLRPIIEKSVYLEVPSIISILTTRNGKPYGAASALETLIQTIPEIVLSNDTVKEELVNFVDNVLPSSLQSPSAKHLIRILGLLEDKIEVRRAYEKSMRTLIDGPDSSAKAVAMQTFISSPRLADTDSLSAVVLGNLSQAMKNDDEVNWDPVIAAIANPLAPKSLTDDILTNMTAGLSISSDATAAMHGLENTMKQNEGLLRDFALSSNGSTLRSKLLLLADSQEEPVSLRARNITNALERILSINGKESIQAIRSMLDIINEGFEEAVAESLSYVATFPCCHFGS